MLDQLTAKAAGGEELEPAEVGGAIGAMLEGAASPVLVSSFLTALRMKGETPGEVSGAAAALRAHAVNIRPKARSLVDTCGTGGGSVPTFNISTTAAFVVAGAGIAVAKHGNRAMTSRCGSADVLEALGVRIQLPPERVCRAIDEIGIGFLFAQAHHPAMRYVAPIRRELPFRTLFNLIGPLSNPAGAPTQLIGVYEPRLVPLMAQALALLGSERAIVVHGVDGLDELSTLGSTDMAVLMDGRVVRRSLDPGTLGFAQADAADLAPGADPAENAAITRSILAGDRGPRREIVLLNAGAGIYAAGAVDDLAAGIAMAERSIDSGAAQAKLTALAAFTADA
jgi:anthranilate phosphoribosyltransferase